MTGDRVEGPLSGIRVVDLTSVLFGPLATLILADLGADVIKVESPDGDVVRRIGPARTDGMGPLFLNFNRNKRSVVIDLKDRRGVDALLRVAATCDVFVHSMRPRAIERLGLGYAVLADANERIVYCNLVGFGSSGRYRDLPAYDDVIQAGSGVAALQGALSGAPQYVAAAIADKTAGLAAVSVLTAALFERERSGQGQELEVPMFETLVSQVLLEHLYGATFEPPLGPAAYPRTTSRERRPYPTSDGFISVIIYTDRQWASFWQLAGADKHALDPRFCSLAARTENIDDLYAIVASLIPSKPTAHWLEILTAASIPALPVNTPEDLLTDPHLEEVGLIQMQDHPSEGLIRVVAPPFRFSRTPAGVRRPAPKLGADTAGVLAESGFEPSEVEELQAEGVVGPAR